MTSVAKHKREEGIKRGRKNTQNENREENFFLKSKRGQVGRFTEFSASSKLQRCWAKLGATDGTFGNQNNQSQTQPFLPLLRLGFVCCPQRICPPGSWQPFRGRSWTRYLQADCARPDTREHGKARKERRFGSLGTYFACRCSSQHTSGSR